MRVNRWLDLLDRVGWTIIQAFAGSLLVTGLDDWVTALEIAGAAAVIAAVKVIVAQNAGSSGDGSAVPGGVTK